MNRWPVARWPQWIEPQEVFAEWERRPHCVWLDTAGGAGEGISILAAAPSRILATKGPAENPFPMLAAELSARQLSADQPYPVGAAIGFLGYDLKNCLERLPARAVDDLGLPDCWFGFYDHLLVFDHTARQVWEVGVPVEKHAAVTTASVCPDDTTAADRWVRIRSNFSRAEYCDAIRRAKEYIAAGDIYQVNLSQRFQCHMDVSAPELYATLRQTNPAPYCAYLDIGDAQILSTSPECFLQIRDREVVTRPIKGTRPRRADPAELLASAKDNAELLMITDLERNDLGRVCAYGRVHVRELKRVESFATVHHLVSTVAGRLRPDVSHVECVRACFPGGSITGAPKIRAMEIIDELEPHARGVYTGAIGFFGYNGVSHFNVAIRTAVYQRGRLTFHAGGGIVADSEPDAEYEETLDKAQGIVHALDQLRLRQRPVRR